jgi:hypothetical protein
MKYKYVVILKNDRERATDIFSILLCLFSALTFAWLAIRQLNTLRIARSAGSGSLLGPNSTPYILAALALVLLTGLVINVFIRRYNPSTVRYRFWLLLAALGWIGLTPLYFVGLLVGVLAGFESRVKRPLEIGFDDDRVVINYSVKIRYDWSAFTNVILKDGLLTLDFKTNRIMQKELVDDEDEDDADEEEFNIYCRSRLTAVSTNS